MNTNGTAAIDASETIARFQVPQTTINEILAGRRVVSKANGLRLADKAVAQCIPPAIPTTASVSLDEQ